MSEENKKPEVAQLTMAKAAGGGGGGDQCAQQNPGAQVGAELTVPRS